MEATAISIAIAIAYTTQMRDVCRRAILKEKACWTAPSSHVHLQRMLCKQAVSDWSTDGDGCLIFFLSSEAPPKASSSNTSYVIATRASVVTCTAPASSVSASSRRPSMGEKDRQRPLFACLIRSFDICFLPCPHNCWALAVFLSWKCFGLVVSVEGVIKEDSQPSSIRLVIYPHAVLY